MNIKSLCLLLVFVFLVSFLPGSVQSADAAPDSEVVKVNPVDGVEFVTTSEYIATDGTVWMWVEGDDHYMALNTSDDSIWSWSKDCYTETVEQVIEKYIAGRLEADGTVWAWGENAYMQNDNINPDEYPEARGADFRSVGYSESQAGANAAFEVFVLFFDGLFGSIDSGLMSGVKITLDGKPVEVSFDATVYERNVSHPYKDETWFSFTFDEPLTEPGLYRISVTYDGVTCSSDVVVEGDTPIKPASADSYCFANFGAALNGDGGFNELVHFYILFNGVQGTFPLDSITDFTVTRDGEVIDCGLVDGGDTRRSVSSIDGRFSTSYSISFTEPLSEPGVYRVTGKYMDAPFDTGEIVVTGY